VRELLLLVDTLEDTVEDARSEPLTGHARVDREEICAIVDLDIPLEGGRGSEGRAGVTSITVTWTGSADLRGGPLERATPAGPAGRHALAQR